MGKYATILVVELEAEDIVEAKRQAKHLAAGLGNSEETLVESLTVIAQEDAAIVVEVDAQDIAGVAHEADCLPEQVVERLHAMYKANLYEDLKWVSHDIQEAGV